jgi:hypothetical protein
MDEYHPSADILKLLQLGDPGTGKTVATAALANAGYRVINADLDNGLDVVRDFLTPEGMKNYYYETFTDPMTTVTKGIKTYVKVRGTPFAFQDCMKALDHWKFPERKIKGRDGEKIIPAYDLGRSTTWGSETVLVVDSLNFLSMACLAAVLAMNEADLDRWVQPYPADYLAVQRRMEGFLDLVKSKQLKCNVIVNTHIRYMGGGGVQITKNKDTGTELRRELDSSAEGTGYPFILGRQLPGRVGTYFNAIVLYKANKQGKREILTETVDNIPLRCPAPRQMPRTLPCPEGIVTYFDIVKKHGKET